MLTLQFMSDDLQDDKVNPIISSFAATHSLNLNDLLGAINQTLLDASCFSGGTGTMIYTSEVSVTFEPRSRQLTILANIPCEGYRDEDEEDEMSEAEAEAIKAKPSSMTIFDFTRKMNHEVKNIFQIVQA